MGSHFNQALNSQEHKSNHLSPLGPITSNSLLSRFTEGLNLNDLWSLTDPDGRKFTFSPPIQHSLQNRLLLCQHHTSRLSCKPPYTWNSHLWPCPNISRTATVGFTVRNLAKIWRFPSYLDRDQTLQKIIQETWTKYLTTNTMSIPVYFERLEGCSSRQNYFLLLCPQKGSLGNTLKWVTLQMRLIHTVCVAIHWVIALHWKTQYIPLSQVKLRMDSISRVEKIFHTLYHTRSYYDKKIGPLAWSSHSVWILPVGYSDFHLHRHVKVGSFFLLKEHRHLIIALFFHSVFSKSGNYCTIITPTFLYTRILWHCSILSCKQKTLEKPISPTCHWQEVHICIIIFFFFFTMH